MANLKSTPILDPGTIGSPTLTPSGLASAIARGATPKGEYVVTAVAGAPIAVEVPGFRAILTAATTGDSWAKVEVVYHPTGDLKTDGVGVSKINRLVSELQDGHAGAPRWGYYWRDKAIEAWLPSVSGPQAIAGIVGKPNAAGGWAWGPIVGLARTPITKAKAQPKAQRAPKAQPKAKASEHPAPSGRLSSFEGSLHGASKGEPKGEPKVEARPKASPAMGEHGPRLFKTPAQVKPAFKVHHDARLKSSLDAAVLRHKAGFRTVALITGPSGVGKTLTAKAVAAQHGYHFAQVDAAGMVTFADWAGSVSIPEGESITTRYTPSRFVEMIRNNNPEWAGVPRVVLIDEVSRVPQGGALNALMSVIDDSASLYIADAGRTIEVDPAVMFVLTANIGSDFTGTVELDWAFVARATNNIKVTWPSTGDEVAMVMEQSGLTDRAKAAALVSAAAQVRGLSAAMKIGKPGVATRQAISAAINHVHGGQSLLDAALDAFVNAYPDEGGNASDHAKVATLVEGALRGR